MKKTNFNESVERFKERIKTDKKFKTRFATATVAVVVVISTAISVPTAVHNHKINAEENTVAPIIVQGKNEIESLTEEAESTANEESQPASEVSETENTETKKPTEKKAQESKKNSSNSQNKNNTSAKKETTTASEQMTEHVWTQAEVDAIVTEIKQYAISRGFRIDDSMTTQGTSWNNPANTSWYSWAGDKAVSKVKSDLKEEIEWNYNDVVKEIGYFPENVIGINIIAKSCYGTYGEPAWEIYVVY